MSLLFSVVHLSCDKRPVHAVTAPFTAHPKFCPDTGEMLAFGYSPTPPYLTYFRVDPQGKMVQSTEITVTGPTMMHDFAVSRNYAIFMDLPAIFDMELAMSGGMPIRWSDDYPARFGVMPREGTDAQVKWFNVNPCYCFHTLNAFEEDDELVVYGGSGKAANACDEETVIKKNTKRLAKWEKWAAIEH